MSPSPLNSWPLLIRWQSCVCTLCTECMLEYDDAVPLYDIPSVCMRWSTRHWEHSTGKVSEGNASLALKSNVNCNLLNEQPHLERARIPIWSMQESFCGGYLHSFERRKKLNKFPVLKSPWTPCIVQYILNKWDCFHEKGPNAYMINFQYA